MSLNKVSISSAIITSSILNYDSYLADELLQFELDYLPPQNKNALELSTIREMLSTREYILLPIQTRNILLHRSENNGLLCVQNPVA